MPNSKDNIDEEKNSQVLKLRVTPRVKSFHGKSHEVESAMKYYLQHLPDRIKAESRKAAKQIELLKLIENMKDDSDQSDHDNGQYHDAENVEKDDAEDAENDDDNNDIDRQAQNHGQMMSSSDSMEE